MASLWVWEAGDAPGSGSRTCLTVSHTHTPRHPASSCAVEDGSGESRGKAGRGDAATVSRHPTGRGKRGWRNLLLPRSEHRTAERQLAEARARGRAGGRGATAGAARGSPGRAPGAAGAAGSGCPRGSGASGEGGAGQQPAVAKPAVLTPRAEVCPGGCVYGHDSAQTPRLQEPPLERRHRRARLFGWRRSGTIYLPGFFFLPLLLSFVL